MNDKSSGCLLPVILCAVLLLLPALVFTAVPNIFFGFESAGDSALVRMTEQAKALGGAYFSLEDFEKTQIDAVITSMVSEYESSGTAIDRVELNNSMEEDDLLWIIAINSVAHKQNLEEMSAEDVQAFCLSRLSSQIRPKGIRGCMPQRLRDDGLGDAVLQHGGCQVVPEDMGALPVSGFLPYPRQPAGFCHDASNASGSQG